MKMTQRQILTLTALMLLALGVLAYAKGQHVPRRPVGTVTIGGQRLEELRNRVLDIRADLCEKYPETEGCDK